MKDLVVFDLDGTLAKSKSPLDDEMAAIIARLLGVIRVAIISGGDYPQFEAQVIGRLPADARLERLSLLPTCGTKFYEYADGLWRKLYSEDLTGDQRDTIVRSLEKAVTESGLQPKTTWGERIEDRGTQITYSALGQEAPLEAKSSWDPDFSKRQKIKTILDRLIPNYSVRLGGTTSIDVTLPGIDKAYGMRKLREILGIDLGRMLFVGDAIFPGGNDYAVYEMGAESIRVRDPEETKRVNEAIIACTS